MKALFDQLGAPPVEWCCLDDHGMPPPALDVGVSPVGQDAAQEGEDADPAIQAFRQYCAKCHQGLDESPPNFLHGRASQIQANLAHCAERIFFRLEMTRMSPRERPETPMPPTNALRRLDLSPAGWAAHADLAVLKDYVGRVLEIETGEAPHLQRLGMRGYDNLRACLPTS